MKIADIKANEGSISIEADVISVDEPRTFNKYGRDLRVANAVLQDDSGQIKLTLWNDEIEKVKAGDKVKITNGFARAFKDEVQLTAGKFGKIEVVGKADLSKAPAAAQPEGKVEVDESESDDDEW